MSEQAIIKTGFCVSYDWELLKKSIPPIYEQSDMICLAIDKNRKSWSGNKYEFDEDAFRSFVLELDKQKKIDIYEDDFSRPDLNARQNCNRHRTMIAERLGKGGWHIQIDSDEYFTDFPGFVATLIEINPRPTGNEKPINVCPYLIPLIKRTASGYIYVDFKKRLPEIIPFATTRPQYERARQNGHFNIIVPIAVLHETWARSENELLYKLNNWGHSAEELHAQARRQSFYRMWQAIDENNYQFLHNFHPAVPEVWPALGFAEGTDIQQFMATFNPPAFPLSKIQLSLLNNRNFRRMESLAKKVVKVFVS